MMKEADLNQNGCVGMDFEYRQIQSKKTEKLSNPNLDFKSFSAITRSASETLSAMAGRYIASNQIGRGAIRILLIRLISSAFLSPILYTSTSVVMLNSSSKSVQTVSIQSLLF